MTIQNYHLGCPIWSNRDWNGRFFSAEARTADYLRQYSSVFNTVEGNTTFYGLPRPDTVARWAEQTTEDFRFCFKFPRRISHELRLHHTESETREFLHLFEPLSHRLGPLFLQLPPQFSPRDLPALATYLDGLPQSFKYAVEVRHPAFFNKGKEEQTLNRLLHIHGVDRVILDSRAPFTASVDDLDTLEAQRKKPRLPVHAVAIGQRPLVRFIGHPEINSNRPFLGPWVRKASEWIAEGREPYFFTHTPNNRYAPGLAKVFHELLSEQTKVGTMPLWPMAKSAKREQMVLF